MLKHYQYVLILDVVDFFKSATVASVTVGQYNSVVSFTVNRFY